MSLGIVTLGVVIFAPLGWMVVWLTIVSALTGILAGYGWSTWRYQRGLSCLNAGMLDAQDGNLKPVEVPRVRDPLLQRLYREYNKTITTLGGMFALVEECQNRVLSERNRMDVVIQVLPAALLGVDDNLYINTVNKQAEILFGKQESHLVGVSLFDVLLITDETREILRDAFLYHQDIRNQVINLQLGDAERWLSMNLSFATQGEGGMAAVITLLDITEYKQLQESVYTREKLVAMGQLAAGVAHELNTPLGNILGYSQLLVDSCEDPERARHFAQIISDQTKRCSHIIHNLLNYARKEKCQGEFCDVNTLVNEVVDTLISCRLKRYEITLERDLKDDPVVDGGCGELDIVLTNLLINSVQALEGVEHATLRVQTGLTEGGVAYIVVEDNGPGIPRELRSRIFEPFFTTKEVGDGSGLGLSISHAMVSRRGGTLRFDSEYRDGARFIIRLPNAAKAKHPYACDKDQRT
ncbi:two-component system sensor histidine kinase NtrB [Thioalkalivibrio sp.]|uniref:two-component system sensor histidine kinase NtrB n=1 Tax=Thioalkalivibrio sp. TaxID=2093813 RepID=UPI003975E3EB